jgi:hypothetical protein
MNIITFSHKYEKLKDLNNNDSIKLLEVINVKLENLSNCFLTYDTDGVYKLPKKGNYLMLIFEKGLGDIFTTLRSYSDAKERYYTSNIGEFFIINIIEKK